MPNRSRNRKPTQSKQRLYLIGQVLRSMDMTPFVISPRSSVLAKRTALFACQVADTVLANKSKRNKRL